MKKKIFDLRKLPAVAIGDVHYQAYDSKQWYSIVLKDDLFVPIWNLIFFSVKPVLDYGYSQQATAKLSLIMENNESVLMVERYRGLFLMKFRPMEKFSLPAVSSLKLWHKRIAHQNIHHVKDILKRNNIK